MIGRGSVQDRRDLCAVLNPVLTDTILRVPLDLGTSTRFALINTSGGPLQAPLRLRSIGPDMEPDVEYISLNGLPPGQPVLRTLNLQQGGTEVVEVSLQMALPDVTTTFTIIIEADTDGDGEWEPVSSFNAQGIYAPPCTGDYNRDGSVDGDDVIAFFQDWDNGIIEADVTGDDAVDGDDVIFFFNAWDQGC
jgi:hypothetical protein